MKFYNFVKETNIVFQKHQQQKNLKCDVRYLKRRFIFGECISYRCSGRQHVPQVDSNTPLPIKLGAHVYTTVCWLPHLYHQKNKQLQIINSKYQKHASRFNGILTGFPASKANIRSLSSSMKESLCMLFQSLSCRANRSLQNWEPTAWDSNRARRWSPTNKHHLY